MDGHMDEDLRNMMVEVPKAYAARFTALVGLTDAFCDAHLNAEYKGLCREMAVAVCQKGSPVLKGKPEGWAAGIVCALGRVNFLSDPSDCPHMKSTEIAKGFGVSVTTMQAKTKVIWEGLDLVQLHPDWCLPSKIDDNPLVWMLQVNGFLVDTAWPRARRRSPPTRRASSLMFRRTGKRQPRTMLSSLFCPERYLG
jgi:hypothetical protein